MATQSREAQNIREQARILVTAIGYEQTGKRLDIKPATLRQWAKRFHWNATPKQSQAIVTTVTKPSLALQETLSERSNKTKLGLSKAAMKAAEHLATMAGSKLVSPATASAAKSWAGTAESVHQWQGEAQKGQGVLGGLQVYSRQTVIQVQQKQ